MDYKTPNGGSNPIVRCLLIQTEGGGYMGRKSLDPKSQFSKWLARWTTIFWAIYLIWLSVILIIRPEVSLNVVYIVLITTVVMLMNVWAYTKNSTYEKGLLAMLDKVKIQLGAGKTATEMEDVPEEDGEEDG